MCKYDVHCVGAPRMRHLIHVRTRLVALGCLLSSLHSHLIKSASDSRSSSVYSALHLRQGGDVRRHNDIRSGAKHLGYNARYSYCYRERGSPSL
jgi:hypothetical protein